MKKLALLTIVFFSFLSCTTDDLEVATNNENLTSYETTNSDVQTTEIDPTKIVPPTGG
jgi:hypothetical protein